jgi:hypothetical protein
MNKIRELEVRFTNAGVAFYKAGIALMDECEREWAKDNTDPNLVAICKLEGGRTYKVICKKKEADAIRKQMRDELEVYCLSIE